MIEFDVDMGYLLDYDELDKVVLNDENGEHEPMEFVPKDAETVGAGTCRRVFIKDWLWECSECHSRHDSGHLYNFCPNCGRRVIKEEDE